MLLFGFFMKAVDKLRVTLPRRSLFKPLTATSPSFVNVEVWFLGTLSSLSAEDLLTEIRGCFAVKRWSRFTGKRTASP